MAEETFRDVRAGITGLTLQGVSEIQASLTEKWKVPEDLVLGFNSEDPQIRKASVIKIRQILQNLPPSTAVQPVIDTGLVPDIVSLLDSEVISLQGEAAWIVTMLASGTIRRTERVVNAGAVPRLIILFESRNVDAASQAVWALGKILADPARLRGRVEEEGGVAALVKLVDRGKADFEKVQRTAVWAIFRYLNPQVSSKLPIARIKHVILCLARYIRETPVNEENMQSIKNAVQALERTRRHRLQHTDFIATAVLSCLGYLVGGGDDDSTDAAVDAGLLPGLLVSLESKNRDLCGLALWNPSHVAGGSYSQVHALLDSGLLKPVVRVLMDDQEPTSCRGEACQTISSLTSKVLRDDKVVQAFIKERCVEALSATLLIPGHRAKELAVSGITNVLQLKPPRWMEAEKYPLNILRSASGPQNLRAVRDSRDVDDEKIKRECQDLLTRYFPDCSRRARV
ncbi:hypothetical protein M407DRAFT_18047 [Tulasnella calospora MUT 4182]|uniref:Importin subunit alpha n=1 Tax=Tulasnella calospora MUT 4182 TaxID=1051891 RepID=A0A0C3LGU6_9AGAM|nr:hypothetical protein M407DRAFT_18047 [Tulasnella calospora MUT 4182]